MVWTLFSDANILNIFSGGSLLAGHAVASKQDFRLIWYPVSSCVLVVGAKRY